MLGQLDEKLKSFLHVLRRKEGVANTVVAAATENTFIARTQNKHLKCIDLDSSYWAKSLFPRMGFTQRTWTCKPEIPELAKQEPKLIFQHRIINLLERYCIQFSLIMNFDQTPLKYSPVTNQTLSKKRSKHVAIKGLTSRQSITANFGINFSILTNAAHLLW